MSDAMGGYQPRTASMMTESEMETQLTDLLGQLTDEQIRELADLAEAMHAEGTPS